MKKSYTEWDTKFFELSAKRAEVDKFVEDFGLDLVGKLKGMAESRMISIVVLSFLSGDSHPLSLIASSFLCRSRGGDDFDREGVELED